VRSSSRSPSPRRVRARWAVVLPTRHPRMRRRTRRWTRAHARCPTADAVPTARPVPRATAATHVRATGGARRPPARPSGARCPTWSFRVTWRRTRARARCRTAVVAPSARRVPRVTAATCVRATRPGAPSPRAPCAAASTPVRPGAARTRTVREDGCVTSRRRGATARACVRTRATARTSSRTAAATERPFATAPAERADGPIARPGSARSMPVRLVVARAPTSVAAGSTARLPTTAPCRSTAASGTATPAWGCATRPRRRVPRVRSTPCRQVRAGGRVSRRARVCPSRARPTGRARKAGAATPPTAAVSRGKGFGARNSSSLVVGHRAEARSTKPGPRPLKNVDEA